MMKKIVFILAILILVVVAGCAKPVAKEPTAPAAEEPVQDGVSDIESVEEDLSDADVEQDISELDAAFSDW